MKTGLRRDAGALSSSYQITETVVPQENGISLEEMQKAEACCQPEKELVCQEVISHSSDNFPDYLAGETGA